jgi:hypothetical protein
LHTARISTQYTRDMKSVLIVGAGPAGLVTAKTLLQTPAGRTSKLKIVVFEQNDRVGGMWALHPDQENKHKQRGQKCSPNMRTNLSRFTVAFSDFSWDNVEIENGKKFAKGEIPMYPKAWQVGKYLQSYAKRYIRDDVIKLNCKVTYAAKVQDRWKVQWTSPPIRSGSLQNQQSSVISTMARSSNGNETDESEQARTREPSDTGSGINEGFFDYLIVASGFFHEPKLPRFVMAEFGKEVSNFPGEIIHSSQFRDVRDIIPPELNGEGKIVVVGGGMSGSEISGVIAAQLSDLKWAPEHKNKLLGTYPLLHITSKPFYTIPRYVPKQTMTEPGKWDPRPSFLPFDLAVYDLARRPPGRVVAVNGVAKPERCQQTHKFLESIVGGNQSYLNRPELVHTANERLQAPRVGLTDIYAPFVRSGDIIPVHGRAMAVECQGKGKWKLRIDTDEASSGQVSFL